MGACITAAAIIASSRDRIGGPPPDPDETTWVLVLLFVGIALGIISCIVHP